jgi:hypothetical protein
MKTAAPEWYRYVKADTSTYIDYAAFEERFAEDLGTDWDGQEIKRAVKWAREHKNSLKPTSAKNIILMVKLHRSKDDEAMSAEDEDALKIRNAVVNSLAILKTVPPDDRAEWIWDEHEDYETYKAVLEAAKRMEGGVVKPPFPKGVYDDFYSSFDADKTTASPKGEPMDPSRCRHEQWTAISATRNRCPDCGEERDVKGIRCT